MEDNEEEEDNDDYPIFTAPGDSTMGETKLKKSSILMSPFLMSPMTILVGTFVMRRKNAEVQRRS